MSDFKKFASKRAVVIALQRLLMDNHIRTETNAATYRPIICEELPRSESEISEDFAHELFEELSIYENDLRVKMIKASKNPEDLPPWSRPEGVQKTDGTDKPKKKKKRKPESDGAPPAASGA